MQPARAMVLTACALAHQGGGEGVLDGVAGGGCGDLVVFDPRGATAPEGPQDEERGDGQCDAARDRERSRHAVKRSVEHLTQSEAETQAGEAAPGRRERHEEEGAGLAQACPSGTTHRETHAFGGQVIGARVYRVREGRVACAIAPASETSRAGMFDERRACRTRPREIGEEVVGRSRAPRLSWRPGAQGRARRRERSSGRPRSGSSHRS